MATINKVRFYSYKDLREFAENSKFNTFHVYYYGFYDGETGEDPHGVLHSVDSLIDFLKDDEIIRYRETMGHSIICFGGGIDPVEVITA